MPRCPSWQCIASLTSKVLNISKIGMQMPIVIGLQYTIFHTYDFGGLQIQQEKNRDNFLSLFMQSFSKTLYPADANLDLSNHSNATISRSNTDEIELQMSLNASCPRLEVLLPAQLLFGREFCSDSAVEHVTGQFISDCL